MRDETLIRPDILPGVECPVHGVEDFKYVHAADLWACLGAFHAIQNGTNVGNEWSCSSCVLGEDFTPDGFDVVDALQTRWHNVTFEHGRYEKAWFEYYSWSMSEVDDGD